MMRLTEEQYEMIRPLLPVQRGNVRLGNLDVINAVLYVVNRRRNGTPDRRAKGTPLWLGLKRIGSDSAEP